MSVITATKKTVTIEAIEWTGYNLNEVIKFTGQNVSVRDLSWGEYEELVSNEGLKIFNLEGSHMASVGDYIVKGINGEFSPWKPDIFKLTHDY